MDNEKNNRALYVLMFMGCILILILSIAIEKNNSINDSGKVEKVKNIIILMPDSQAFSNVIEARIFMNGIDGDLFYQKILEDMDYKINHSASADKTYSTVAASTLPISQSYKNSETPFVSSVLKLAKAQGKATGIVVTSEILHANHLSSIDYACSFFCGTDNARQYIEDIEADLIFGGGLFYANPIRKCESHIVSRQQINNNLDILDLAIAKGYKYITNSTEMAAAVTEDMKKILGIFGTEQSYRDLGKTPEMFRVDGSVYPYGEPTLSEITAAAMNILEKDSNGFLLMVEGTQVDRANHGDNIEYLLAESLAFDEAVNEVLGWVNKSPVRRDNTLVIVLADHDCADSGIDALSRSLSGSGDSDPILGGLISRDYKWDDSVIFCQGPGNERHCAAAQ